MTAHDDDRQSGGEVLERTRDKTVTPKLYRVLLLNDDYTTMEFVVAVIEEVFRKTPAEAFRLMMQVHTEGRAVCGAYTYEVAETKVDTVRQLAERGGFPLQAAIEGDG
ncbi:MAG: ATP-dependent Clp protease adaptor ClpS [Acidobacteria bacterium]|nr:ATP-dependent Clp protease adaptor ClpS [Acidobacteriota bacterium]